MGMFDAISKHRVCRVEIDAERLASLAWLEYTYPRSDDPSSRKPLKRSAARACRVPDSPHAPPPTGSFTCLQPPFDPGTQREQTRDLPSLTGPSSPLVPAADAAFPSLPATVSSTLAASGLVTSDAAARVSAFFSLSCIVAIVPAEKTCSFLQMSPIFRIFSCNTDRAKQLSIHESAEREDCLAHPSLSPSAIAFDIQHVVRDPANNSLQLAKKVLAE